MRSVFVSVVLSACGGEVDPHGPGSCDVGWTQNGFDTCEKACEVSTIALNAMGMSCQARTIEDVPVSCNKTFEFEGVVGCCSVDDNEVHFADCE